ncbi:MAG: hypothetical protein KDA96_10080 [Planctomycetaceae bacterium]|nr:hypothetical protein [Planctomycetaceae bacterium]
MKKILGMAGYAFLLFGLTAGVGYLMKTKNAETAAEEAAEQEPVPLDTTSSSKPSDSAAPLSGRPFDQPGGVDSEEDENLPVAVRPEIMTVEEIVRYGMGLKERDQAISQREDALKRTESRHRLLQADIQTELKEIEGVLVQARDQRMAVENLLRQLAQNQQKLMEDKDAFTQEREKFVSDMSRMKADRERMIEEMKKSSTDAPTISAAVASEDRKANAKKLAAIAEGMDPDAAASMLTSLANDGQQDDAAEILANLDDKKCAQIIGAMKDEGLKSELVNLLLSRKTETKSAARGR